MYTELLTKSGLPPKKCADKYKEYAKFRGRVIDDDGPLIYFQTHKYGDSRLRDVNYVRIYMSDIEFILDAMKKYNLLQGDIIVLFCFIFLCRLDNKDHVDLKRQRDIVGFCNACNYSKICIERVNGKTWRDGYSAPPGMSKFSDEYGIIDRSEKARGRGCVGCTFTYPMFYNTSEGYIDIHITKENNKLDINKLCHDLDMFEYKFCKGCGEVIKSSVRREICLCEKCRKLHRKNVNATYYRKRIKTKPANIT